MGSVSPELLDVSALPVGTLGRSDLHSGETLLLKTTGLLADGSKTSLFSMGVLGGDDPVDLGVTADNLVGWVNHNNFVELVGGVLTNPVRVEDTEVATSATNTLFGNVLVGLGLLKLGDTHVSWLTVNATLAD